jgi:hypothetical protein
VHGAAAGGRAGVLAGGEVGREDEIERRLDGHVEVARHEVDEHRAVGDVEARVPLELPRVDAHLAAQQPHGEGGRDLAALLAASRDGLMDPLEGRHLAEVGVERGVLVVVGELTGGRRAHVEQAGGAVAHQVEALERHVLGDLGDTLHRRVVGQRREAHGAHAGGLQVGHHAIEEAVDTGLGGLYAHDAHAAQSRVSTSATQRTPVWKSK